MCKQIILYTCAFILIINFASAFIVPSPCVPLPPVAPCAPAPLPPPMLPPPCAPLPPALLPPAYAPLPPPVLPAPCAPLPPPVLPGPCAPLPPPLPMTMVPAFLKPVYLPQKPCCAKGLLLAKFGMPCGCL